jgi:hypothetical protein
LSFCSVKQGKLVSLKLLDSLTFSIKVSPLEPMLIDSGSSLVFSEERVKFLIGKAAISRKK